MTRPERGRSRVLLLGLLCGGLVILTACGGGAGQRTLPPGGQQMGSNPPPIGTMPGQAGATVAVPAVTPTHRPAPTATAARHAAKPTPTHAPTRSIPARSTSTPTTGSQGNCHGAIPRNIPPLYPREIVNTQGACAGSGADGQSYTYWGAVTFDSWSTVGGWFQTHLAGNGWEMAPPSLVALIDSRLQSVKGVPATRKEYILVNYGQKAVYAVFAASVSGTTGIGYYLYALS